MAALLCAGAFAVPASAHNGDWNVSCGSVSVHLTNYNAAVTNSVSVSVDGGAVLASEAAFGAGYDYSGPLPDHTSTIRIHLVVHAGDGGQFNRDEYKTAAPCATTPPTTPAATPPTTPAAPPPTTGVTTPAVPSTTPTTSAPAAPVTASASSSAPAVAATTSAPAGSNLAVTGSSSATPMIAGIAAAVVVVGGGLVFVGRKRRTSSSRH